MDLIFFQGGLELKRTPKVKLVTGVKVVPGYLTTPVAAEEGQDEGDAKEHHHVDIIKQRAHRVPLLLVTNHIVTIVILL